MPDTEMLFPLRAIPLLRSLRGQEWQNFIDSLTSPDASTLDQLAFVLLMVRLGGCLGCNADSFRAMKGCTQCAKQTVKRFRGSDKEFIRQCQLARHEVSSYLGKKKDS